ncbi:MAG: hypothetical protein H0T45_11370 [Pyrinomonadaceae bacterium]|nr:hypothetical protein [Pyrinomonadaceae bacterium]MDQ3134103.1 hypothetical protein [Acidobacteriota bacterium]
MKNRTRTLVRTVTATTLILAMLSAIGLSGMAQQQGMDKRRQTTIQQASVDHGQVKNAASLRYLNLPWGASTFGYIETGVDTGNNGYYSSRTWPIAHLTLAHPATHNGQKLSAGDYVIYITPKGAAKNDSMTLTIASFQPAEKGGSFLKAGNVFAETPANATAVSQKPVAFAKGGQMIDHLEITMTQNKKDVMINFHYGDRTLTEKLTLD